MKHPKWKGIGIAFSHKSVPRHTKFTKCILKLPNDRNLGKSSPAVGIKTPHTERSTNNAALHSH